MAKKRNEITGEWGNMGELSAGVDELQAEAETKAEVAAEDQQTAREALHQVQISEDAARAAWDALFYRLQELARQNPPGYAGSKLERLLTHAEAIR